jgi:hypothetical protein
MAIEFREVRQCEIDQVLSAAAAIGTAIEPATLRHELSLTAVGKDKATLGSALHHVADDGRHRIRVHLAEAVHPGLARLLIDRALRKAATRCVTTARIEIDGPDVADATWSGADLLARMRSVTRPEAHASAAASS